MTVFRKEFHFFINSFSLYGNGSKAFEKVVQIRETGGVSEDQKEKPLPRKSVFLKTIYDEVSRQLNNGVPNIECSTLGLERGPNPGQKWTIIKEQHELILVQDKV